MIQKFFNLSIMYRYGMIRRSGNIAYKTDKGAKREMKRQYELFLKNYNIDIDKSKCLVEDDKSIYLVGKPEEPLLFTAEIYEVVRYPIHDDKEEIGALGGALFRVEEYPDTILEIKNEAFGNTVSYNVVQGECKDITNKKIVELSYKEEVKFIKKRKGLYKIEKGG